MLALAIHKYHKLNNKIKIVLFNFEFPSSIDNMNWKCILNKIYIIYMYTSSKWNTWRARGLRKYQWNARDTFYTSWFCSRYLLLLWSNHKSIRKSGSNAFEFIKRQSLTSDRSLREIFFLLRFAFLFHLIFHWVHCCKISI